MLINNIKIDKMSRCVTDVDRDSIGVSGEHMQEKLVFHISEFIDGQAYIEIRKPNGEKGFIDLTKNEDTYELVVKNSLLDLEGLIYFQIHIVQAEEEVFKSEIFSLEVKEAINATETIPEQYPSWKDELLTLKQSLLDEESKRNTAEQNRNTAELKRENAEKKRETGFEEMKKTTEEAVDNIKDLTESYNQNAIDKTAEFNANAKTKKDDFDKNTVNKTTDFNKNATTKTDEFNINFTNKSNALNDDFKKKKEELTNLSDAKIKEINDNSDAKVLAFNENYKEKIDSFNENAKNETDKFNNNASSYDKRITLLEENQIHKEIEGTSLEIHDSAHCIADLEISGNSYQEVIKGEPGTTVEGTNLTLTDVDNSKENEIVTKGNSYQEIREGYNIARNNLETQTINGLDITKNKDGSVTINGTSTASFQLIYNEDEIVLNGDYVFYMIGKTSMINLQGIENNTTVAYLLYAHNQENIARNYTEDTVLSKLFSWIEKDKIYNNITIKIMITKGSEIKKYEQYGIMPSPGFKSDVKSCGENRTITENFNNKQFYNVDDCVVDSDIQKKDERDFITLAINNIEGTVQTYNNYFTKKNMCIKPNTEYYLVLEIEKVYGQGDFFLTSNFNDKNNSQFVGNISFLMDNLKPGDIKIYRIISKNNFINSGTLLRSFLTCKSGDSCSITFRISLLEIEPTLEDFKYISHERKSFIIPVQQKMLEEDYFDNKRKKEVHTWGKLTLTGNESIKINNYAQINGKTMFEINMFNKMNNSNNSSLKSNMFKQGTWYLPNEKSEIFASSSFIVFHLNDETMTTVEQFKSKLTELYNAGTPIEIYYKLETPVELDLTQEQSTILDEIDNFKLYNEVTYITSNDEIEPIVEVTYNKVTKAPSIEKKSEVKSCGDNVNLFKPIENYNINNIEVSKNSDGTINLKGTATKEFYLGLMLEPFIAKANENYSIKVEKIDGNTILKPLWFWNQTDSNSEITIASNNNYNKNFSFKKDTTLTVLNLTINQGDILDCTIAIKLEKGKKSSGYSKNGQGSITVVHNNANILDTSNVNKTVSGLKLLSKEIGAINVSGSSNTTYLSINSIILDKPLKKGTNLFLNYGKNENLLKDTSFSPFLWLYNTNNVNVLSISGTRLNNANSIPDDVVKIVYGIEKLTSGTTYNEDIFIDLRISDKMPEKFIKYSQKKYVIPTQKPFRKIDNYKDTFVKKEDGWYEKHKLIKIMLKDYKFDSFIPNSDTTSSFATVQKVSNLKLKKDLKYKCLSNFFIDNIFNFDKKIWCLGYDRGNMNIQMSFDRNIFNTVEKLNSFIEENDVYIVAVLEDEFEELIKCTEEQSKILDELIELEKGTNYIYSTDEIEPNLKLNYAQSAKMIIDDINNKIANLQNAIVTGGK